MICPHCSKPISFNKDSSLKKKALKLVSEGYSARDVEAILKRQVSFSTVAKWARESKESKP